MICLLDLNFTLVANSHEKRSPFTAQIQHEQYRQWLVEKLRNDHVILITARPERHAVQTLTSIKGKTGWNANEAFFNQHNLRPPQAKERILIEHIFPKHGSNAEFFAIESNPLTRAMYAKHGIKSAKVEKGEIWQD